METWKKNLKIIQSMRPIIELHMSIFHRMPVVHRTVMRTDWVRRRWWPCDRILIARPYAEACIQDPLRKVCHWIANIVFYCPHHPPPSPHPFATPSPALVLIAWRLHVSEAGLWYSNSLSLNSAEKNRKTIACRVAATRFCVIVRRTWMSCYEQLYVRDERLIDDWQCAIALRKELTVCWQVFSWIRWNKYELIIKNS